MKEGGDRKEEGRRTEDMYKIRSLLLQASLRVYFVGGICKTLVLVIRPADVPYCDCDLQGQIAGLRDRLKEREADVRELRMLTGGRGQSRLRWARLEPIRKSRCRYLTNQEDQM